MTTQLTQLDAHTMLEADGGHWRTIIDDAIAEACLDIRARPALEKARKIMIQIEITPDKNARSKGDCSWAIAVDRRRPREVSPAHAARAYEDGRVVFNEMAPENVDQGTLDLDAGEEPEARTLPIGRATTA